MISWIIYNEEDVEKNRRFIKFVTEKLSNYNIATKLIILQEQKDIAGLIREHKPDFAINRSRNCKVALMLEVAGVKVFNNSKVTKIANNKEETFNYLDGTVEYMPFFDRENKDKVNYPCVIKEAHSIEEKLKDVKYIYQECSTDLGKDVRVYIVGNKIIASMLRTSTESFKSNYSLGGSARPYELNNNEKSMVRKILKKLPIDYGGIDFIFNNGKAVFNEIEDAVGARMIYEKTDIDIVGIFVDYIVEKIKG
jgi:ribosomal protein S6--L-glutamate ligase/gamma-F420-2:alpha-L-glutamate ligase